MTVCRPLETDRWTQALDSLFWEWGGAQEFALLTFLTHSALMVACPLAELDSGVSYAGSHHGSAIYWLDGCARELISPCLSLHIHEMVPYEYVIV